MDAISDLWPVFPSSNESFDAEVGERRIAIVTVFLGHIAETRDRELTMFPWNGLEQRAHRAAQADHLVKFDAAVRNFHSAKCVCLGLGGLTYTSGDVAHVTNWSARFFRRLVHEGKDSRELTCHARARRGYWLLAPAGAQAAGGLGSRAGIGRARVALPRHGLATDAEVVEHAIPGRLADAANVLPACRGYLGITPAWKKAETPAAAPSAPREPPKEA